MGKYRAVAEQLLRDGAVASMEDYHQPIMAPEAWLTLAHDADYVAGVLGQTLDAATQRKIGFKVTKFIEHRTRTSVAGTVLAARLALENGIAGNLAGGSHHATPEGGAGFCVFNDVGVAGKLLLAEGSVSKLLIVDLDVHQGDGTAKIFADEPRAFTFSLHCEKNWPRRKVPSDLDIGLDEGIGDDAYLRTLAATLPGLISQEKPDLVFFNAGVDPHREDRLGLLDLSDDGLAKREAYVIDTVKRAGVPHCVVMGGGYSRDVEALAKRHALAFAEVAQAA
ncbi:histone deacetylase [Hyphobacterium sp.]|jgi:acetoin utilization deacetylase AcuC-like enzyme|uniref:histone deacetylase family protein n=1 Tax=Hyphobacterium sp. TaxID=2004662 RepID=UPI003BAD8151